MIKDYLLYFSNNVYKDSLYIHLKRDYQIKDETKFFNDVEVLYKQKEPIVYMIHNISRYTKIRMDGYIYLPSKILLDVINPILINAGLEPLAYKDKSGFTIGKITAKTAYLTGFYYEINLSDHTAHAYSEHDIPAGKRVVVIEEGVSLDEKRYFLNYELEGQKIDAYLVSEKDLSISELNKPIIIDKDIKIGSDFFYLEEK